MLKHPKTQKLTAVPKKPAWESTTFADMAGFYEHNLLNDIIPFWEKWAIDWENGGINTCIRDDGKVISGDKYIWSQLRALWVFSTLYQELAPKENWRKIAEHIFDFCLAHGRDAQGRWVWCVSQTGEIKEGAISIFVEGFAIYGLGAYFSITGSSRVKDLIKKTWANAQAQIAKPGSYGTAPTTLPNGIKKHTLAMLFSLATDEAGRAIGDLKMVADGRLLAMAVMDDFLDNKTGLVDEYLKLDNSRWDHAQGRTIVPGHGIESMWFLIHQFERTQDGDLIQRAVQSIRANLEKGWDPKFGGILLAMDRENKTPVWWKFHDTKLWWPQSEALYATLLAYRHTGQGWCLEWFRKLHAFCFTHYPVEKFGEWTQKLNRDCSPLTETIALPVKDPFHLPRALFYSIQALKKLAQKYPGAVLG